MIFGDLHWAYPLFLFLLLLLAPIIWLAKRKQVKNPGILFSAYAYIQRIQRDWNQYFRYCLTALRVLALIILVIILVRPQREVRVVDREIKNMDIMLVIDLSESMSAYDIRPYRLQVAKRVMRKFIQQRKRDRIGLVVFSGTAITVCPLTFDHEVLLESLGAVDMQTVSMEGTAMGDALLVAVNRLLHSREGIESSNPEAPPAKNQGKIVILATDGANNRGFEPMLAAQVIAKKGLKLYTIALGGKKPVLRYERDRRGDMVPVKDIYGRLQYWEEPDVETLESMADISGGRYFRAENTAQFNRIMSEIDRLEKRTIQLRRKHTFQEEYTWFLMGAMCLLLLEVVLRFIRFRNLA
ncbi:VWA domain-containing protein [bacterium]|nr:VWA domain-containing protein [bacterium]